MAVVGAIEEVRLFPASVLILVAEPLHPVRIGPVELDFAPCQTVCFDGAFGLSHLGHPVLVLDSHRLTQVLFEGAAGHVGFVLVNEALVLFLVLVHGTEAVLVLDDFGHEEVLELVIVHFMAGFHLGVEAVFLAGGTQQA